MHVSRVGLINEKLKNVLKVKNNNKDLVIQLLNNGANVDIKDKRV